MAFSIHKVVYMVSSWGVNKLTTGQKSQVNNFINTKAMQKRNIYSHGLGKSFGATEAIRVRDRVQVAGSSVTPTHLILCYQKCM